MSTAATLTLLAMTHCLLLAIGSTLYGGYKTIANRLMAFILLAEGARLFAIFLFIKADHYPSNAVEYLMVIRVMLAPTLFLYTQALTESNFKLAPRHFLHMIPWALSVSLVIWNNHTASPIDRMTMTMIQTYITSSTFIVYGWLAVRRINRYQQTIEQHFSNIERQKLNWLKIAQYYLIFIGLGYIVTGANLAMGTALLSPGQILLVSIITTTFFIYLLSITSILHFRILDQQGEQTAADEVSEIRQGNAPEKYQSGMTQDEVEHFLSLLNQWISEDKPYLEHRLKLSDVANAMGLHPQQISQVINQGTGMNFHDYINSYRIEHALGVIAADKTTGHRVNTLYEDCGFSSQSTFYKYFKKATGTTPKQYMLSAA